MTHEHSTASTIVSEVTTTTDVFELLGRRVQVRVASGEARAAVRALLQGFGPLSRAVPDATLPAFELGADPSVGWRVLVDGQSVHTGDSLPIAVSALEWHVISTALEQQERAFHVHGGALCAPTERAGLVLTGPSGQGKTTLTMALMLRGFVPFADDAALIDPETLALQPFPRAFHVDGTTWDVLAPVAGPMAPDAARTASGAGVGPEERLPPGHFAPPQWATRPVPVRWLLWLNFKAGRTPRLVPLSAGEAASAVLGQTASLSRAPRVALSTVARLTANAACYRFETGDLAESVALVQQLVSGRAVVTPPRG